MKSLINKICRIISVIAGIVWANALFWSALYEALWSFWSAALPWVIFGTVIKKIVFPDHIIDNSFDEIEQDIYNKVLSNSSELSKISRDVPLELVNSNIINPNRSFMDMILGTWESWTDNLLNPNTSNISMENTEIPQELKDYDQPTTIEIKPQVKPEYIYQEPVYEESKLRIYIKNFFAENALAKIGGILLFLGAMFFVSLIYIWVWWIGKLIIWLLFGFAVYGVGIYLDQKDLKAESQICLWVWIAINYMVILGARYLMWDRDNLTETTSFIFLISNTLLAVVTGIIYRSNVILVFGFLLAYITPVLVWWTATSPYFVSTYAAIVSLGAFWLSCYIHNKDKNSELVEKAEIKNINLISNISNNLLRIWFVWAIATFVMALMQFPSYWITQIIYISVISIITIIISYRNDSTNNLISFSFGWYAAILLAIFLWYQDITSPYIISIYMSILFAWSIYLSIKTSDKPIISNTLMMLWFASLMIILVAVPFQNTTERIFKLIMIAIAGIVSIYFWSTRKINQSSSISWMRPSIIYILATYICVFTVMLWWTQLGSVFSSLAIYISYILTLWVIGGYTIYLMDKITKSAQDAIQNQDISWLLATIFIPLGILLIMLFMWLIPFVLPTMIFGFAMIIWAIFALDDRISQILRYTLLAWLALYILSISWFLYTATSNLWLYPDLHIWLVEYISTIIVSFALLATSYYISSQKDMDWAYSAGTLMHILILLPILHGNLPIATYGSIAIALTVIMAVITPIIIPKINQNPLNVSIWLILSALFAWWEIYTYRAEHNLWHIVEFLYIWLAAIYILPWAYMIIRWTDTKETIYTYLWVAISSIAIALAFIFAKDAWALAISWVSMWAILMYIYSRLSDGKIYIASLILYAIWLVKLFTMFDTLVTWEYVKLIPIAVIFILLIVWLYFIRDKKDNTRWVYDAIHILWIWAIWAMIYTIVPHTWHGRSTLGISWFALILSLIYSRFYTWYVRYVYIFGLIAIAYYQISNITTIFDNLESIKSDNPLSLKILQYISTALIAWSAYIQYTKNKDRTSDILLIVMSLYLFGASTIYIYDIFDNTFAISIYWWIVAYILLHLWISWDKIKLRTIWLYIIWLTLAKVGLYDIWYGIDDGIMRVVALMVLGWLLIYISTLYTRKYGGKMSWELNPSNLWNHLEKKEQTNNL